MTAATRTVVGADGRGRRRERPWSLLLSLPILAALGVAAISLAASPAAGAPAGSAGGRSWPAQAQPADLGAELYATQCSTCHGLDGRGVEGRGPTLETEGEAATDFVLRTGRMPLAAPNLQARRGPVRYSEEEIVALVEYVGSIGDGPGIPDVDPDRGDVANGGELYRLNCAACHVASGAGAPIGGGREAPSVMRSSAVAIGEAILVGPGAMPVFGSLEPSDIDDIAAYIAVLQEDETTSASNFGGAGPVAEGLAAWLLGLLPLVALTRWIGSAKAGRDRPVDDEPDGAGPDAEPASTAVAR